MTAALALPPWSAASDRRREHIARVVGLLEAWIDALRIPDDEARGWRDAGRWHDALRDASEAELRATVPDVDLPVPLLHGPAAARRLEGEGETRHDVIEAVRWHTVGWPGWARTGRALYMADYLDPGRAFARRDRAYLAARVPDDFDGTFRQVVRHRLQWGLHEGHAIYPETAALWNCVR
jgi:2-amino-4-hydroxy-6-hydroxymethyldihydropteridine diphosphokinase